MKSERKCHAVVVLAKCRHEKKNFGIRFQEMNPGIWTRTWAFAINDSFASKENFGKNSIKGTIECLDEYPGCPYCEARGIFLCYGCNRVSCWNGETTITCPHCNTTRTVRGLITGLDSGRDR
jgi:hypothetical protein